MKHRTIPFLFLLCLLLPSHSIGQVAGAAALGGRTGASGSPGVSGSTSTGGFAGRPGVAGASGSSFAGAAGLGGALVARRRYIGVRVEGTDWLSALIPTLGLLSLGAVLVTMIKPRLLA